MLNNLDYEYGRSSYTMTINEFSDWEEHEYRKLLGFRSNLKRDDDKSTIFHQAPDGADLPKYKNWVEEGAVTAVKDQGQCGSCWAFSSIGAIESAYYIKNNHLIDFSEQQLVDCSLNFENYGCGGGWMENAYKYIEDVGGIMTNKSYPYISGDGSDVVHACRDFSSDQPVKVAGHIPIRDGDEEALMHAVATHGPVAVAIDATGDGFSSYSRGVYIDQTCSLENLDHAVLVVGYGEENGHPYWLVKNSWTSTWGDHGYIKMLRGRNMCGIASKAIFPEL